MGDVRPQDVLTISELASALGVRSSTLRHWDAVGRVVADRDERDHRRYTPPQVRDARIVHQLRSAGYRIEPLRQLMPQLRQGDGDLGALLAAREKSLTARSLALLDASVHLHALIS